MREITVSGLLFYFFILIMMGIVFFTREKFFSPLFSPSLGFAALFHSLWMDETS
jgi:hypothetical protein